MCQAVEVLQQRRELGCAEPSSPVGTRGSCCSGLQLGVGSSSSSSSWAPSFLSCVSGSPCERAGVGVQLAWAAGGCLCLEGQSGKKQTVTTERQKKRHKAGLCVLPPGIAGIAAAPLGVS